MTIPAMLRGARGLVLSLGARREAAEVIKDRAFTCAQCTWLRPCGGAWVTMVSAVYEWVHRPRQEKDWEPWKTRQPWKCGLCGCPLRVKARLNQSFIMRHTDRELAERAPTFCWWHVDGKAWSERRGRQIDGPVNTEEKKA